MEMSVTGWMAFSGLVVGLLALDLGIFHRRPHSVGFREALTWSAVWIAVALGFASFLWVRVGSEPTLEFLAGYLIEKSLSIDNIFVFLLCFQYFRVPAEYQHKVLFWGVLGALLMRGAMIAAGVTLLHSFHWLVYVFGAFLIVTGIKLAFKQDDSSTPENNLVVRLARRFIPLTGEYEGDRLFVQRGTRWLGTPLLLVLLCVETTDLVFAIDSIPAILAVTDDPFIVYTSNVFALLGMRALYFAVQGLLLKLRFLHYGLAAILVFVGLKMTIADIYKVPTGVALATITVILAAATILSLLYPEEENSLAEATE